MRSPYRVGRVEMTRYGLCLATLIVVVAVSFVTLSIFALEEARDLAGPYGLVMLTLALANLAVERKQK